MRHRLSRLLVACVILSIVLHFTIGPFLVWLLGDRGARQPPIVDVSLSTALRITHRTHPIRSHPRPKIPVPKPVPHPVANKPQPRHVAQLPHELARIVRQAPPQPQATPKVVALNITRDTAQFEKTIARLREQQNPVLSAARVSATPEAMKNYAFNASGAAGAPPRAQGILEPLPGSPWHDGGYDYYYVRYSVVYEDGSTESGIVPWPIRYLPEDDPFRLGIRHIPLPVPLPDYELPGDTDLHPLVAYCYEHRYDVPSCPIHRDPAPPQNQ